MMPSVPVLRIVPSLTPYHGGMCSHRLKRLEKSNRRVSGSLSTELSMDIGHRDAGDSPVDAKEVNLENLSSETTLETGRSEGIDPSGPQPVVSKCLEDSTTTSSLENNGREMALPALSSDQPLQHTKSMPIKSAMKGSREKAGKEAKKLSVSWAPDVYDPVPNSLCHTVKSSSSSSSKKKSRKDKDSKKNGKKGQKGNSYSSRGSSSSSKDKKQVWRKPAAKSYKALDIEEVGYGSDGCSSVGFEVASPDHCGSSFLKQSVTEFHYSVAEAL